MPVLKRPQVPAEQQAYEMKPERLTRFMTVADYVEAVHNQPYDRQMMVNAVRFLESKGFERQRDLEQSPAYQETAVLAWQDPAPNGNRHLVAIGKKYKDPDKMFMTLKSFDQDEYRVKVRQYMTKPMDADYWLAKWNTEPMPHRVMRGKILDETKGMYYMTLHGAPEPRGCCPICGRMLTNPVSVLAGIGPECGGHMWDPKAVGLNSEEEARKLIEQVKERMSQVVWTGWCPKSAIIEMDKVVDWEAGR